MSSWTPRTTVAGIRYGQAQSQYYWDYAYNPGAYFDAGLNTYDLALPNCTTYAWGRVVEMGAPGPITDWHNASVWHMFLKDGWTYIPYDPTNLKPGDIVEWTGGNHVAVVEKIENGDIYVSQSYYCDDNGQATNNYRSYTLWGSTKASVDNYGFTHWPNRYFNYGLITSAGLGYPQYILVNPKTYNEQKITFLTKKQKRKRVQRIYV